MLGIAFLTALLWPSISLCQPQLSPGTRLEKTMQSLQLSVMARTWLLSAPNHIQTHTALPAISITVPALLPSTVCAQGLSLRVSGYCVHTVDDKHLPWT